MCGLSGWNVIHDFQLLCRPVVTSTVSRIHVMKRNMIFEQKANASKAIGTIPIIYLLVKQEAIYVIVW